MIVRYKRAFLSMNLLYNHIRKSSLSTNDTKTVSVKIPRSKYECKGVCVHKEKKKKKKKKVRGGAECKVKPGFLLSRGGSV